METCSSPPGPLVVEITSYSGGGGKCIRDRLLKKVEG